jgi:hypothetical protein
MSYNDMGGLSLTGEYAKNKAFLASFKEILDLRGATYLMNNENNSTFVNHGSGNGSENLNDNFDYMMEIKDGYKTDTNDKNFPEALKQDARTQLAIIDDIEYKLGNALAARTNNSSMGGRSNKRKRTKRRSNKRKKTKRKQMKRKSNKRKY